MSAPKCRECGAPVLQSSWTASFTSKRTTDNICMNCRRKHGMEATRRKLANRRAFGESGRKG